MRWSPPLGGVRLRTTPADLWEIARSKENAYSPPEFLGRQHVAGHLITTAKRARQQRVLMEGARGMPRLRPIRLTALVGAAGVGSWRVP